MTRRVSRKPKAGWSSNMEQRADLEGRQVKCLIASKGHLWMRGYFDRLPPAVRHRLAESRFNICAACMDEEAHEVAARRKEKKPSIATYFAVIERIEQQLSLDQEPPAGFDPPRSYPTAGGAQ
jgi:hypothetical protein